MFCGKPGETPPGHDAQRAVAHTQQPTRSGQSRRQRHEPEQLSGTDRATLVASRPKTGTNRATLGPHVAKFGTDRALARPEHRAC